METPASHDEAELAFRVYKMLDGNEAFSNVSEFHVMPVLGEDGSIVSVQVTGIQQGGDSESCTLHTQVFDILELGDTLHLQDEVQHQESEEACMDGTDEQSQGVSQETPGPQETADPDESAVVPPVEDPGMKVMYSCGDCKFSSSNLAALMRHKRRHSDKHKCKLCEKTFASASELRLHINVHLGIKPHKCRECDMTYGTAADLLRHTRSVHSHEKPFRCCYCDYTSAEVSRMKIHIRSHTGERPFTCLQCSFATTDAFKLRRHVRTHTGEKPYSCDVCQAKFTQRASMKMHMLRKHTENLPKEHCPICNAALFGKHDVQVHIRKQHAYLETPVKCRFCPETFHERYILRQHQQSHRNEKHGGRPGHQSGKARSKKSDAANIDGQDGESGPKDNCLTWNLLPSGEETQLFVSLDGSEQPGAVTELHSIPMQTDDGSIVQALVVQSTETVDPAELHAQVYELQDLGEVLMEQHSSSSANTGSIVIAVNGALDQTILTEPEQVENPSSDPQGTVAHPFAQVRKGRRLQLINPENQIEVKLHRCKDCDKSFSTGLELLKHKKSHKEENLFKCPFCEHETSEAEELIAHVQMHSEDRPFHCDQCDYSTTDSFKLTRHKRTHTEIHIRKQHSQTEKELKCRLCPATFHERFLLRQHQKVHQKEKMVKSCVSGAKRRVVMRNSTKPSLLDGSPGPQEEVFSWQVVPTEQEAEIHLLLSGSEDIDTVSEYHVLPVQTEDGSIIGIPVSGLQEVEEISGGAITQVILGKDV
ncbi:oocyte zinc finger protein XlCOF28-like isoform X2 [Dendropsophus ebraccatus]|uniref:oocyte zinc finger protein XlCOF28-like isoform X2 n=1 Tax=Dendropsophus ebraccatus TaxID=150705 RepID=UPI00383217C7